MRTLARLILLALAVIVGTAIVRPAQTPKTNPAQTTKAVSDKTSDTAPDYRKEEHYITMRDGIRLHTTVYRPVGHHDPAPILIQRTPYSCKPYGEGFATALDRFHMRMYMDEGYILVFQDVRGRYMSEGEFVHMRPLADPANRDATDETTDAYDTVEWLLTNIPGNNGRVGFTGYSYPGFYALMGALSGHPAVKAVSPQAPATDWYMGDDTHHNGAFALADSFSFIVGMERPRTGPATTQPATPKYRSDDEYRFFMGAATIDSLSRMINADYAVPFWNDMMAHPHYDEWWQARDARRGCYDIAPAILIVGGHFDGDDLYGTWNLWRAIRDQSPATDCRIVVGPWNHGGWNRRTTRLGDIRFGPVPDSEEFYRTVDLPFFNHHLKGSGSVDHIPAARVYVTGENRWHDFDSWPPRAAEPAALYLNTRGRLTPEAPKIRRAASEYTSDPANPVPHNSKSYRTKDYMFDDQRFVADRSDVLTFVGEPLERDVTLVGELKAELKVSLSTTDADFVVKLIDVFPDGFNYDDLHDGPGNPDAPAVDMGGYRMLVRGEIMRGRYRKGFSTPVAFQPDRVTNITFSIPDVAHTFLRGHRIMVQVQSSWFPLFDRNPQQMVDPYHCSPNDFIPSQIRVYHQRGAESRIVVNRMAR